MVTGIVLGVGLPVIGYLLVAGIAYTVDILTDNR